jgi:hypothetical protein
MRKIILIIWLFKFKNVLTMKDVNIREIRNRLQHGDLTRIQEVTGISARRIGEVLNKGRNSGGCKDAVLGAAMDILKNKGVGRELLISKAEDLKLTTADTIPIPYRSRKKGRDFRAVIREDGGEKIHCIMSWVLPL